MGRPQFTRRNEPYAEEQSRKGDTRTLNVGQTAFNNPDPSSVGGNFEILEDKSSAAYGDEAIQHIQTAALGFPSHNGYVVLECQTGVGGQDVWAISMNPGQELTLNPSLPYPENHVLYLRTSSFTGSDEEVAASVTMG